MRLFGESKTDKAIGLVITGGVTAIGYKTFELGLKVLGLPTWAMFLAYLVALVVVLLAYFNKDEIKKRI